METETPQVPETPEAAAVPTPAKLPKAAKAVAKKARGAGSAQVAPKKVTDPMERIVCITLHDSPEIPPNGQFVGVNGKQFIIKPGRKVLVPRYVVEALNNAVHGIPDIDDQKQVQGVRQAPRLAYTLHLDYEGEAA